MEVYEGLPSPRYKILNYLTCIHAEYVNYINNQAPIKA